jgi:WD40 repeat protein
MKRSLLLFLCLLSPALLRAEGLPVAELKRDTEVNFATEVYPFLKANCLACHNESKPKAGLSLESPQDMLKGGDSGPAIVAGKGAESFLFTTAAHLEDPAMPPANNKSKAENLKPDQLALLKLWIDQGAKGDAVSSAAPTSWTLLKGPQPIYTAAISADGRYAAAARGQQVHLYDLKLGKLAASLRDPALEFPAADRDLVQTVAFSPDGRTLATGGYRVVKVWQRTNAEAGKPVALPADPAALAVSPDGKRAAFGVADGSILLVNHDTPDAAPVAVKDHAGAVSALAFSADGATLFSGSPDKTVKSRPVAEPAKAASLAVAAPVLSMALLHGGKQVLLACADQTLRIVSADLKTPLAFTAPPAPKPAAASPTGPTSPTQAAAAPAPAPAKPATPAPSPEPASSKPLLEFKPHAQPLVGVAAVKADGSEFAAAYADGTVIVFQSNSALPGDAPKELRRLAHGSALSQVAVSGLTANPIRLATTGAGGSVKVWNPADGKMLAEFKGDPHLAPRLAALTRETTLATRRKANWDRIAPEAETLLKAESEKAVSSGEEIAKARRDLAAKQVALKKLESSVPPPAADALQKARDEAAAAVRAVATAERNRELSAKLAGDAFARQTAAKGGSKEAESLIAALKAEIEALTKAAPEEEKKITPLALALSADGGTVYQSLAGGMVRTWSGTTPGWLEDFTAGREIPFLATAGDRLVSASKDKQGLVWSLPGRDWALVKILGDGKSADPFVDRVTALAFSPDGSRLLTGTGVPSRGGRIALWETAGWSRVLANDEAHKDTLTAFSFSPDGSRFASSSTDKLVKLFETETLTEQQTFEGHTNHVLDVAWNADDLSLATASADLKVKVWDLADGRVKSNVEGYAKEIGTVVYVGDTESLLTASGDKAVKVANAPLPEAGDSFLHTADASLDGTRIIAGGQDSILRVWDGTAKKLIASFPSPEADAGKVAGK